MKLAIMQPYAFPYLGYFQLMSAVDRFVVLDTVSSGKHGWVNRNVVAGRAGPHRFTIPLDAHPSGMPIGDMTLHKQASHRGKLLKTLATLYGEAPLYPAVLPMLEDALGDCAGERLVDFVGRTLSVLRRYLRILTPLVRASERHSGLTTRGQDRVLDICVAEGATAYINAEGGIDLYDPSAFAARGIDLRFLVHDPRPYPRFGGPFIPRLSIIDVLMFNSAEQIQSLLQDFHLVRAPGERHADA